MGNPALTTDHERAFRAPTLAQAARRLLDALDRLHDGDEAPGFAGWENSHGENAGDQVEEARHELAALLANAPARPVMSDAFERAWMSETVQTAFRDFGWRGGSEALWRIAMDMKGVRDE